MQMNSSFLSLPLTYKDGEVLKRGSAVPLVAMVGPSGEGIREDSPTDKRSRTCSYSATGTWPGGIK